ncbi:MAG: permease [Thiohalocapsa sp.]
MFERYLIELWQILLELSPSLLLGLFIAGLMHVYLPAGMIHRGLNRPNLASVLRASLLGVPLPLCSCGVIPTALGLRKEGASVGATTSFMISTPQTGIDSILVSAAFLGWPFAIFKVVAAFATGIFGGALVNRFVPADPPSVAARSSAQDETRRDRGLLGALHYAVFDLLAAIDLWLIAGVLAAALVTTLTPPDFFSGQVWAQGLLGMLVVLAISLPLYVCTTASVPIAASLIAAGMPAGSALVFLMAGPATNVATIGAVYRTLGPRVLGLYLGTVVVMSLLFGLTFDQLLAVSVVGASPHAHGTDWLSLVSTLLLLLLLGLLSARRLRARMAPPMPLTENTLRLQVEGMTCQHCVGSVKRSLEALDAVDEAQPELSSGLVSVRGGRLDASALIRAVEQAGFSVVSIDPGRSRVDAQGSID